MKLEELKRVLVEWDDSAYEIIKNYVDSEISEEFIKQYLGVELYERLRTMTRFCKKFEEMKLKYNHKV